MESQSLLPPLSYCLIPSYCLVGLVHFCTYLLSTCIVLYRPVPYPLGLLLSELCYTTPHDITSLLLFTHRAHRRPAFRKSAAGQHSCFHDHCCHVSTLSRVPSPESRVPTIVVLCPHHCRLVSPPSHCCHDSTPPEQYCCEQVLLPFSPCFVLQFCRFAVLQSRVSSFAVPAVTSALSPEFLSLSFES